jgi:superfamily I DNA/RNA helicase/mRNA-degrading endonuclease RelE of RelBE toxin-antitoxin system
MSGVTTLRILERADKEILNLSRADKGAVWDFMSKFRQNPHSPGLQLKQLKGDSRLWSARVTKDYRALLLHIKDHDYLLAAVRHRSEVYDNLDRYSYQINQVTGGIEVIDLTAVDDSVVDRVPHSEPETRTASHSSAQSLFAHVDDEQLIEFGVSPVLLPAIAKITSENELLALVDCVPQLTAEVLFALYEGKSHEEILELVTRPAQADDESVDPDDYAAAVTRPATQVTTDDSALRAILAESFARWQVFLHPAQRKFVERHYNGPARISGGPGTGKTIVALHRVKHLAEQLPPGIDKPILLTTFNRNLAADLRTRLLALSGPELVARVDIVNIDKLASRVVSETGRNTTRRIISDARALQEWHLLLAELGDQSFTPDFLASEWNEIILGHALTSRPEYFRVRRPRRGTLRRADRDHIWGLVARYNKRLDDQGVWTLRQVAATAARIEADRAASIERARDGQSTSGVGLRYRYQHVVVDEAQDLSAAHWTMLRAMVAPEKNDMFLVGDTHQRIYDNYVTLSSLGINIRGRSNKLTLSYRTTRQILAFALRLLGSEDYDNLDDGSEDLAGYRSLLNGPDPVPVGVRTWADELDLLVSNIRQWNTSNEGTTAICLPTHQLVNDVLERLAEEKIEAAEIGPDGPKSTGGVHVGTLHRFKGLEYQRIVIAAASDGRIPSSSIHRYKNSDQKRYLRERARARSLLFVAATRARDSLVVTWHGKSSEFLESVPVDLRASQTAY